MRRLTLALLVSIVLATLPARAQWTLELIGGGGPNGIPAVETNIAAPLTVDADDLGNFYVVSAEMPLVLRVDAAGLIEVFAESTAIDPIAGLRGDLIDVSVGADGMVYVLGSDVVRFDPVTRAHQAIGVATGGIAVAADSAGRVYLLRSNWLVERYDPADGSVTVVAGCTFGSSACNLDSGSGRPATEVYLGSSSSIDVDSAGNLYVVQGAILRVVSAASGLITSWPLPDASGGIDIGPDGSLIVSSGSRVYRLDPSDGATVFVAGTGVSGFTGDGGPATAAQIRAQGVAIGPNGRVLMAHAFDNRVRAVDPVTGIIDTVAGNGEFLFGGVGRPATSLWLNASDVSVNTAGDVFLADFDDHRVLRIDADTGILSTYAGTGESAGAQEDGVPAVDAVLPYPRHMSVGGNDSLYVSSLATDGFSYNVRRIDAATGLIDTILALREYFAADTSGNLYVGSPVGTEISKFDPDAGSSVVVLGGGTVSAPFPEGIAATSIYRPSVGAFAVDPDGHLFWGERLIGPIWRVDPQTGIMHRVAAGGQTTICGEVDCSPASALGIAGFPTYFTVDRDALFFTDPFGFYTYYVNLRSGELTAIAGAGYLLHPAQPGIPPISVRSLASDGRGGVILLAGRRVYRMRNVSRPPVADAGLDIESPCTDRAGGHVRLDASRSFDPDQVPGQESELSFFRWYENRDGDEEHLLGVGQVLDTTLPVGRHEITLRVTDRYGVSGDDSIEVVVTDDVDDDGDGVGSCVDNCPGTANADQLDGDDNGVGDACDLCFGGAGDVDGDGACDDLDNCPEVGNADQEDSDLDGVGDACDSCPATENADQAEPGICIRTSTRPGCVQVDAAGLAHANGRGRVLLSRTFGPRPSVTFSVRFVACPAVENTAQLFVNGELLDTIALPPATGSTCVTTGKVLTYDDSGRWHELWRPGDKNELRFVGTGRICHVAAILNVSGEPPFTLCLHGCAGSSCPSSPVFVDKSVVTQDPFAEWNEVAEHQYGDSPLSMALSLEMAETHRVCISATADEASRMYASTDGGRLYEVDPFDGTSVLTGVLPVVPLGIMFDNRAGVGVVQGDLGVGYLQRFAIQDGSKVGGPTPENRIYYALADTGSDPIGAWAEYDSFQLSWFGRIERFGPDGSQSTLANVAGVVDGLAYDRTTGRIRLLRKSRPDSSNPGLYDLDSTSHVLEYVGPAGGSASLEFGPDGLLYGVRYFGDEPGQLLRFDPRTDKSVVVADTGLDRVNELMLVGEQGTVDCVDIDTTGAEVLAINRTCGPVASIAGATTVECQSPAGATVVLDGFGSSDVTSTPGTNDSLTGFEWFLGYGTPDEASLGTGPQLTIDLPIGEHAITLVVTNRFGDVGNETTNVNVRDGVAPELTLDVAPTELWPPNHRLVEIGAAARATDLCSAPTVRVVSVLSSEPDDAPGIGDGTTIGDIQGVETGTADTGFLLRAERSGAGAGRTYTVTYEAVDGSGNVSRREALVVVPHGSGDDVDPLEVYVGKSSDAARIEWTEVPGATSYRTIRGSVSSIRPKPSQIDLGATECLAAEVFAGMGLSAEDAVLPAPGESFFYLVEYDDGVASSYGSVHVGAPRVPGSGGCR